MITEFETNKIYYFINGDRIESDMIPDKDVCLVDQTIYVNGKTLLFEDFFETEKEAISELISRLQIKEHELKQQIFYLHTRIKEVELYKELLKLKP